MSEAPASFGRRVAACASVDAVLALERDAGRGARFAALDDALGEVIVRVLRSERVVRLERDAVGRPHVALEGVSAASVATLTEAYALERQQARGAWFLPTEARLVVGVASVPWYASHFPRYATGMADEERAKVPLATSAAAVLVWSVLEPMFETLFLPLVLRGRLAGQLPPDESATRWQAFDALALALGLDVAASTATMRAGGGWHALRGPAQLETRQGFLRALADQATIGLAARLRASRLWSLVEAYYRRAAPDGRAKRKQVVTKALEPTIAGHLGGDWLAWLAYLDERPHADEQIVTAAPSTKLFVGASSKAVDVAAHHGVPAAEVERMLAAFWKGAQPASPVEQRAATLTRYFEALDQVHARQRPGMQPLWGLVEDRGGLNLETRPQIPYTPELYRELLPRELLEDIVRLWGTTLLPRWPDRIVTEPYPHVAMAETFGPALKFWHGCALTAWFICEGPSSRTDLHGLAHYHRRELVALEELGTPVDHELFEDLVAAERFLGSLQPIVSKESAMEVLPGISISFSMSTGARRDGFERLRDIITRHRRRWAEAHLARYVRACWETELRSAATTFHRLASAAGKPPTTKQFAKEVSDAVRHWFAGDISGLYAAIGERMPGTVEARSTLHGDRSAFGRRVFMALGGRPFTWNSQPGSEAAARAQEKERARFHALIELAELSLWCVQVEEALGREPTPKDIGASRFARVCGVLSDTPDDAWRRYRAAIIQARDTPAGSGTR